MTTSSSSAPGSVTSYLKWLKRALLSALLILLPLALLYIIDLDNTIRQTFKGKRWDIPARIYASPTELYAGRKLTLAEFTDLLEQLRYRADPQLIAEGSYHQQGNEISLKTRSFMFWDKAETSLNLRISFSETGISQLSDLNSGTNIPIARLDPVQIGSFYPSRKEDRVLIKLAEAPDFLKQALFATEDKNFYNHYGVSLRGLARAIWSNVKAGDLVQGGSTITQQLVKNFYLTSERTLTRKINEAIMAVLLEVNFEKDEILEAYLNEIYLGQDGASAVHGFGLASEFYFARPLKSLPLAEVATLVALVRGPSYYDPRRNPERALNRRNLVLDEMLEEGYITQAQVDDAKKQALNVVDIKHRSVNRYPAFLDLVKRQLANDYKEQDLTTEGLKIFATLDTQVQNALEDSISKKLAELEKRPQSQNLETAALVTRRDSAEIAALAGSRQSAEAGFNRALDALRPIGSLIKPVIYLTALTQSDKFTLITPVSDTAIRLKNYSQPWSPENYDNKEHGIIPLHNALTHSYNLATVRIGMEVGLESIAQTLQKLGVKRQVDLFPSLLLGASALTPLEVTQMYQTIAADGFKTPLQAIREVVAANGMPLQRYPFTLEQVVDSAATYLTNTVLQEVVRNGTAKSVYNYLPESLALAGKTGTTNESKDSWFAGFSGDYLSVVWIGRDDNKPMGLTGASGALQVWISLMRQIAERPVNLIAPDTIKFVWIDPANGLLADLRCAGVQKYPFIIGSEPTEVSPCLQPIASPVPNLPSAPKLPQVNKDGNFSTEAKKTKPNPNPAPASESPALDKIQNWFENIFN